MKKITYAILLSLFSAAATAENEATFDPSTGTVDMPRVSIAGDSTGAAYRIRMQQQSGLNFEVVDVAPADTAYILAGIWTIEPHLFQATTTESFAFTGSSPASVLYYWAEGGEQGWSDGNYELASQQFSFHVDSPIVFEHIECTGSLIEANQFAADCVVKNFNEADRDVHIEGTRSN